MMLRRLAVIFNNTMGGKMKESHWPVFADGVRLKEENVRTWGETPEEVEAMKQAIAKAHNIILN